MNSTEPKEFSLKDWLAEGERLFGADKTQWKWKCINCGHVQSIADFLELKKLGIIKAEVDVGTRVYFSCIGRFDTRIPEEDVGTIYGDPPIPATSCGASWLPVSQNTYRILHRLEIPPARR